MLEANCFLHFLGEDKKDIVIVLVIWRWDNVHGRFLCVVGWVQERTISKYCVSLNLIASAEKQSSNKRAKTDPACDVIKPTAFSLVIRNFIHANKTNSKNRVKISYDCCCSRFSYFLS